MRPQLQQQQYAAQEAARAAAREIATEGQPQAAMANHQVRPASGRRQRQPGAPGAPQVSLTRTLFQF